VKLVIVSQYFWPENFIISKLATKLVGLGHEVTVLTGKPNYPNGEIYPQYRAWGIDRENYQGVDIIRIPIIPRGRGGAINLMANYLSFAIMGIFLFPWLCRNIKVDGIFVFAPSPILMAIPAVFLKWMKRIKLTVWVQDLWPESLSGTGFVKSKLILKSVELVVKWIYSHSDCLLVQSEGFIHPVSKLSSIEKVIYYPNSVDGELYAIDQYESPPDELSGLFKVLEQRFSIVFAGNIGTAQSVETIVDAARILQLKDSEIQLVVVGSGSRFDWLVEQSAKFELTNLVLPGRFDVEMMPHILSQADGLLVTLKNEEVFTYTVPSKLQAYLAMGKPVVTALNGEGARLVIDSGAGLSCDAENSIELANIIVELKELDNQQRIEMGMKARQVFEKNFDMDKMVSKLEEILQK